MAEVAPNVQHAWLLAYLPTNSNLEYQYIAAFQGCIIIGSTPPPPPLHATLGTRLFCRFIMILLHLNVGNGSIT